VYVRLRDSWHDFSACVQVLQFKEMTEAGFAAAGAANRQDFLPALRLLDLGRTRKRLAGLAKARHQFGQSLVDEYRRRHPGTVEEETAPRTVIGDLLRERSPESHDDVVIRTVCLVSQYISAYRGSMHATHAVVPARNAWPMCPAVATTC
jgi:hypothetical protein